MGRIIALVVVLGIGLGAGFSSGYNNGFERGVETGENAVKAKYLVLDAENGSPVVLKISGAGEFVNPVVRDWRWKKRYVVFEVGHWGSAATGFEEPKNSVENFSTDPLRTASGKLIGVVDYRIPGR